MTHVSIRAPAMHSLRSHLILQIFLPVAVLTTIVVWTTFTTVEGLVENRLQKEIELVARTLRMPVQGSLIDRDFTRLDEALNAVTEIGRVYGANVYDGDGRRIAVAGEAVPGVREQLQAAELVAIGEERGLYDDLGGEPVYSYFVPLTGEFGRIEGLLQVVREESDIAIRLGQIRRTGTLALVVVLALILALLVAGHRLAVTRPIGRLMSDMGRVEQGDRHWRARVRGPRELARLAEGLNRMLAARERAERELADRRAAERELGERLRAREKEAALGRFSAGVVHELGAPLTVIDGDARRLEPLLADHAEGSRRLGRIRAQIERTRALTGQLMNFVRDEQRAMQAVDLGAVLERALAAARPEAESRRIEVSAAAPACESIVPGHEIRLEHALLNLVRNAVQAAESRVRATLSRRGEAVLVAVEDDGPGVDPEERERIFEPFSSGRSEQGGTGLGLAIVRSVAEMHGGRVGVTDSEALGGSRFELVLARDRQPAPGEEKQ